MGELGDTRESQVTNERTGWQAGGQVVSGRSGGKREGLMANTAAIEVLSKHSSYGSKAIAQ